MNVERQKTLLRSNVSHQRPPIIEMNCQVRPVVTLCILTTFSCPGKGFEGYQHELDVESIFRLPYEKSFILPAENLCGFMICVIVQQLYYFKQKWLSIPKDAVGDVIISGSILQSVQEPQ